MIPEFAIREWSEHVPWTESEQVEQDLLICRALTDIYKDEYLASHLAFRGGTALHKLFLSPQPRYSEDIDLVQINAEPIKETYDQIRDALAFLGEPKVKQKKHNNTLIVRLESECKYSINSLVYWVTYVHNVVYSFYRSMIYCYINSTQRCAGSIVIDIIPTNGADKRKFFPFAPYFPVTNVIKRYFYPYFPAIIGIKGYSFPYFPYLSGIMKIKTALYSLFSRLDWHKTVVFPCLGEIYEGIRSLSWEIPVT